MKRIGFIVNPVAGMGGRVGLKGTDGVLEEALRRGARPVAQSRAKKALERLNGRKADLVVVTSSGEMGENVLEDLNFPTYFIVHHPKKKTSSLDTRRTCEIFLGEDIDMILFCGGDGTARDVYEVIGNKIPIIGIPAGVKMFSGVFSINPQSISKLITKFLDNQVQIREAEIMDIDEEMYRQNNFDIKLFGYAKTIYVPNLVQKRKFTFQSENEDESKRDISYFIRELMKDDTLYILGAGTTTKSIADLIGIKKTLLGVDLVKDEKLVARDVCERDILAHIEGEDAKIVVSPIGAQGFVFGRGNQQISAKVIKKVGAENIIIIATPYKLSQSPHLLVDTGDEELDRTLSGYKTIVCGDRMAQRKKIIGGDPFREVQILR
ncbi:MAG TPA: ATP-NAD kinase [Methanomicrobia archaeon]|nr:ATP-NAD kinase [Methanomicrobia archaeon]